VRFSIDIAERRPRSHPGRAILRIDVNSSHARQVDDHPAVAERSAANVVAAAADSHQERVLARKGHGINHIGRARAARDDPRVPVDAGVPDSPRRVISGIVWVNHFPPESHPKLLNTVLAYDGALRVDQLTTRHLFPLAEWPCGKKVQTARLKIQGNTRHPQPTL
jgi:hypothetical protein